MFQSRITRIVLLACTFGAPLALGENAVLYWNQQMLDTTRLSRNPPPIASHHMATFHAAIFDAVDGIDRKWKPWLVQETAPAGADMDAAIASAAFTVLNAVWGQAANPQNFEVAYENALAAIPEGRGKSDGIAWGKHVAEQILAKRATSGYNKPIPGKYSSDEPGKWRETPPGFRPPVLPFWGHVTPFVMTSPDQFRAPPPPPLDSKQYADETAYVVKRGARDGAERTDVREHVLHGRRVTPVFREVFLNDLEEGLAVRALCQVLAYNQSDPGDIGDKWPLFVAIQPDGHRTTRAQEEAERFLVAR